MKRHIILFLGYFFISFIQLYAQPVSELDSKGNFFPSLKEDTATARAITVLALKMRDRNIDSCLILSDRAIALSKKLNYTRGLANALVTKGLAYIFINKFDEAEPVLREALPLCVQLNDLFELNKTYAAIEFCAEHRMEIRNDFKLNEELILRALDFSLKANDNKLTSLIYNKTGSIYLISGKLNLSVKYLMLAIRGFEEAKDTLNLAIAYNNLAIDFKNMEKFPDAIKYFNLALGTARSSGNKWKVANRLANLGSVYSSDKQYDRAKSALFEALQLCNDSAMRGVKSNALRYLGKMYMDQNKNDSALYYSQNAYTIASEGKDERMMVFCGKDLGASYLRSGKLMDALLILTNSLGLAVKLDLTPDRMNIYELLESYYIRTNDYKQAYQYATLYHSIKDSIFNLEKISQAEELKTQYETEKKDHQISKLDQERRLQQSELKRQRIIQSAIVGGAMVLILSGVISFGFYKRRRDAVARGREVELNAQVTEVEMKALRAQMNPHFIFNSLRSINEYIQHNKSTLASEYLVKFSKLMRAILENSRKPYVPLENDLSALELYIQLEAMRFENKFNYVIEVANDIDRENTLVPPLLLQPFVENAIIHGIQTMEGDGKIVIRISREKNMILFIVEDNGVGRKKAAEKKGETSGSDKESLGMSITNTRIDMINRQKNSNADIRLSDLPEGLKVEVRLPFESAF